MKNQPIIDKLMPYLEHKLECATSWNKAGRKISSSASYICSCGLAKIIEELSMEK